MGANGRIRDGVAVAACGIALVAGAGVSWKVFSSLTPEIWRDLAKDHFAAIVLLPLATMASLLIVMIFRTASGPLEFEGLGFKFKGASGETAMWVVCFLSICAASGFLY